MDQAPVALLAAEARGSICDCLLSPVVPQRGGGSVPALWTGRQISAAAWIFLSLWGVLPEGHATLAHAAGRRATRTLPV